MLSFTVYGTPKPQGSMRAFMPKGWNRPVLTSDNAKLKPWRQQITLTANTFRAMVTDASFQGPQVLVLRFYFAKPASAKKRQFVTVKPDLDKLQRAVLDACTGVLWRDDSQVIEIKATKHYGLPERVEIDVASMLS